MYSGRHLVKQYCISYLCCAPKTFENEKNYSSLLLPENTIFSHLQKFAPVQWAPSRQIILRQLPVLCSGREASKLNTPKINLTEGSIWPTTVKRPSGQDDPFVHFPLLMMVTHEGKDGNEWRPFFLVTSDIRSLKQIITVAWADPFLF